MLLAGMPSIKDSHPENEMIVKQIITAAADIIPVENSNALTEVLCALSVGRFDVAAEKLSHLLYLAETVFPGKEIR